MIYTGHFEGLTGVVMAGIEEGAGSFRCFGHYISESILVSVKDSYSNLGGTTY